jgi:hypothetical protein
MGLAWINGLQLTLKSNPKQIICRMVGFNGLQHGENRVTLRLLGQFYFEKFGSRGISSSKSEKGTNIFP